MGTWEVVAMDLVEKSVTIPSAKEHTARILGWEQVSVSPAITGHSLHYCPLDSVSF